MRKPVVLLVILLTCISAAVAFARGGQSADDCPAGSKDPDCADQPAKPPSK